MCCIKCGVQLPDNTIFCNRCGPPQGETIPAPQPATPSTTSVIQGMSRAKRVIYQAPSRMYCDMHCDYCDERVPELDKTRKCAYNGYAKVVCQTCIRIEKDVEKRIEAMIGDHKLIDYLFRDFDATLLAHRELAVQLLDNAMAYLSKVRANLIRAGATDEQILRYDKKVHTCFERLIRVIRNRSEDTSDPHSMDEVEILKMLLSYNVIKYYIGSGWDK